MTPTRLLVRDEEERNEPEKKTQESEFKNIWSLDTQRHGPAAKFLLPRCSVAN